MDNKEIKYTIKFYPNDWDDWDDNPMGRFLTQLYDGMSWSVDQVAYFCKSNDKDYRPRIDDNLEVMEYNNELIKETLEKKHGYWSKTEVEMFLTAYPELREFVEIHRNTGWEYMDVSEFTF